MTQKIKKERARGQGVSFRRIIDIFYIYAKDW